MSQQPNEIKVSVKKKPAEKLTFQREEGDKEFDKDIVEKFANALYNNYISEERRFFDSSPLIGKAADEETKVRTFKLLAKMYYAGFLPLDSKDKFQNLLDIRWDKFTDWEKENIDRAYPILRALARLVTETVEDPGVKRMKKFPGMRQKIEGARVQAIKERIEEVDALEEQTSENPKSIMKDISELVYNYNSLFNMYSNKKRINSEVKAVIGKPIEVRIMVAKKIEEQIKELVTSVPGMKITSAELDDFVQFVLFGTPVQVNIDKEETLRSKPADIPSWSEETVAGVEANIPKLNKVLIDFARKLENAGNEKESPINYTDKERNLMCRYLGDILVDKLLDQSILDRKGKLDASKAEKNVDVSFKINIYLALLDRGVITRDVFSDKKNEDDENDDYLINVGELGRQVRLFMLKQRMIAYLEQIKGAKTPAEKNKLEADRKNAEVEFNRLNSRGKAFYDIRDPKNTTTFVEAVMGRVDQQVRHIPVFETDITRKLQSSRDSEITRLQKLDKEGKETQIVSLLDSLKRELRELTSFTQVAEHKNVQIEDIERLITEIKSGKEVTAKDISILFAAMEDYIERLAKFKDKVEHEIMVNTLYKHKLIMQFHTLVTEAERERVSTEKKVEDLYEAIKGEPSQEKAEQTRLLQILSVWAGETMEKYMTPDEFEKSDEVGHVLDIQEMLRSGAKASEVIKFLQNKGIAE